MKRYLLSLIALCFLALTASAEGFEDTDAARRRGNTITKTDIEFFRAQNNEMVCMMNIVLDDLYLARNRQVFLTPVIESADEQHSVEFPTVIVSGRNMHYVFERSGMTKATGKTRYNFTAEYLRNNFHPQTVPYREVVPAEDWMYGHGNTLTLYVDTCGCGVPFGRSSEDVAVLPPMVDKMMLLPYPQPVAEVDVIRKHEGRARVQFEVDRTELHTVPYVCKSGQRIDNREQLAIINDSLRYALHSPNVELVSLEINGFASPESPYEHNDYLSRNRAKAVIDYIAQRENIPASVCKYGAVPENWKEFREQVVAATDITEQQRADLLELIDRPVISPMEYDEKEKELKTGARYAQIYREKILPEWFPMLRCTQFTIATHLKPLTLEQLREVIKTEPQLMSLNKMYLVANSYEHGTPEFNYAMEQALKYYPNDPIVNTNAACMAIEAKDYEAAARYAEKAGDSEEAQIVKGIVATYKGDIDAARAFFKKSHSHEALHNYMLIE